MSKKRRFAKNFKAMQDKKDRMLLEAQKEHFERISKEYRAVLEELYKISLQGIALPPGAIVEKTRFIMEEAGEAY